MTTAVEAVKDALFNEVRSQAFYRLAADVTGRDDCRVVFMELADLEGDHARELATRISGPPFDLGFDARAYVDTLENSVAATVPPEDERTVRGGDVKAVLKLAKRLEREARDSYRDLARKEKNPSVKTLLKELSRLEEGHLREIKRLEMAVDMPEEERPAL